MDLHKNKGQVTVVIDLSFSASLEEVKEFILNEQSPFILSQSDENLIKFEWFIDEDTMTATLLEVFANAKGFELLAGKVVGTPVNLKFRDLFTVEKMTILGEPTENLKEKIPRSCIRGRKVILKIVSAEATLSGEGKPPRSQINEDLRRSF